MNQLLSERRRVEFSFGATRRRTWLTELINPIIDGNVDWIDGDSGLRYFFGDNKVHLHGAASIVRALAGLDIVLRNAPTMRNRLIVVDEPEMNAHPKAQCQITELLSMLVNRGNHVLFTTHSPYILDHLNNLVEAGKVESDRREKLAQSFQLKNSDAFLNPDDVSVYHFGLDGVVTDIFDRDENIIDGSTFGEITRYLETTYDKVLEAQKARAGV